MMFSRCWIVWDKLTGDNGYGDCELAYTSFDRPIKNTPRFWLGAHAKEKEDEKRIHLTQKPDKFIRVDFERICKRGRFDFRYSFGEWFITNSGI